MGAYLGSSAVTAYLGTQEVSVALGAVQVLPAGNGARTLYFSGEEDQSWATLGNWWDDAGHTIPAASLPTSSDSVVVSVSITASGQTVVDFTLESNGDASGLSGTLTVTGNATFNDTHANYGTVTGDATFNDSSVNAGAVTGTATFNDSACNDGGLANTFVPDPPPSC
jgi:hypothetical protein